MKGRRRSQQVQYHQRGRGLISLFVAFDEAYKRTQKSELTAKIAALNKERDSYAYVIQKVAEAWAAKIEDEALAVHGVRVSQVFRNYGFRTSKALVAENAKIHNMEQKLADRELTADLQAMGLTELCRGVGSADNRRLLSRTEQIEQTMGKRNEEKSICQERDEHKIQWHTQLRLFFIYRPYSYRVSDGRSIQSFQ